MPSLRLHARALRVILLVTAILGVLVSDTGLVFTPAARAVSICVQGSRGAAGIPSRPTGVEGVQRAQVAGARGCSLRLAALAGCSYDRSPAGMTFAANVVLLSAGATTGSTATLVPRIAVRDHFFAAEELPTLEIDAGRMPNIASNVQSALDEGQPGVLNRITDPGQIASNRAAATSGFSGPGSPDECPFASTAQGGAGARVAGVPLAEQRIQGGVLSQFYARNGIGDGDPFAVKVTGLEP